MKTILKSALFALSFSALTFTTSLAAVDVTKPGVSAPAAATYRTAAYPSKGHNALNVMVEKTFGKRVSVRFRDARGNVLAEQQIGRKAQKAHLRFNVNQLPDGAYRIDVTDGAHTTSQVITLSSQTPADNRTLALQ